VQTHLLRTETLLRLATFLGCNASSVRSSSLLQLKRGNQFDATASAGLLQWEIKQVSTNHLQQQFKVTCFASHGRGLEAVVLSNLAIQQEGEQGQEREG